MIARDGSNDRGKGGSGLAGSVTYGLVPGEGPRPDGDALPVERTPQTMAQMRELREEVAAVTPQRLGQSEEDYRDMVDDRMRAMTRAERTLHELEMTQRRQPKHEVDHDPLPYGYTGYDPLPVDIGAMGQDNWGSSLPRPAPQTMSRGRGWYRR
jgi:hypothetical protein